MERCIVDVSERNACKTSGSRSLISPRVRVALRRADFAAQHNRATRMQALWRRYDELLSRRPIVVKALTSLVGFAVGDVLAQLFVERPRRKFSVARLLRLSSFGLLVHGPSSHAFYGALDHRIGAQTDAGTVALKVAIDQLFWNPCFSVLFFGYTGALEMKGAAHVLHKIEAEGLNQVTGSWRVWPIAHAINFRLVPTEQRVLFINTVQVSYNCFLSLLANREAARKHHPQRPAKSKTKSKNKPAAGAARVRTAASSRHKPRRSTTANATRVAPLHKHKAIDPRPDEWPGRWNVNTTRADNMRAEGLTDDGFDSIDALKALKRRISHHGT